MESDFGPGGVEPGPRTHSLVMIYHVLRCLNVRAFPLNASYPSGARRVGGLVLVLVLVLLFVLVIVTWFQISGCTCSEVPPPPIEPEYIDEVDTKHLT